MNIAGKTAVVTGSATGIGRASAIALATRGAGHVVLVDIDAGQLAQTAKLVAAAGAQVSPMICDLSAPQQIEALFAQLGDDGGFDILHNNAGIMSGPPAFPATPTNRIPLVVGINLTATILCTRLAVDILGPRGGGVIVNTSSQGALRYGKQEINGRKDLYEDATYAATKAGVQMFTQSCAQLQQHHGIRVVAICPGLVETPILTSTGGNAPADWVQSLMSRVTPLTPEAIANAVIRLIEDETVAGGDYVHVQN